MFANPHLACDQCKGRVTDRSGNRNEPCGHQAGFNSVCPSWSPVDGCRCAETLGTVDHPPAKLTPAETCAAVAAKIRGLARNVPHGPWRVEFGQDPAHPGYPQRVTNPRAEVVAETFTGPPNRPTIAHHLAMWDPITVELIARLFDGMADYWRHHGDDQARFDDLPIARAAAAILAKRY